MISLLEYDLSYIVGDDDYNELLSTSKKYSTNLDLDEKISLIMFPHNRSVFSYRQTTILSLDDDVIIKIKFMDDGTTQFRYQQVGEYNENKLKNLINNIDEDLALYERNKPYAKEYEIALRMTWGVRK